MSDDASDRLHEIQFRAAIETRNFEISLFWQRSNYFLALSTAIAVGYFTLDKPQHELLLSLLGSIVAWLWFLVNLGGKFWQARWEHRLGQVELGLNPDLRLFTVPTEEAVLAVKNSFENSGHGHIRGLFDWAILWKPSVSHAMISLSLVFLMFWLTLVGLALLSLAQPERDTNCDSPIPASDSSAPTTGNERLIVPAIPTETTRATDR